MWRICSLPKLQRNTLYYKIFKRKKKKKLSWPQICDLIASSLEYCDYNSRIILREELWTVDGF